METSNPVQAGLLSGPWPRRPCERHWTAHVHPWFGAGGAGRIQVLLGGAEGRRNALRVDGCRESGSLPRVVQRQDVGHGFSGSAEAPWRGDGTARRFNGAVQAQCRTRATPGDATGVR